MKKWTLIMLNLLVLAAGVLLSVLYTFNYQKEKTEMAKNAFASTVRSMEQVSSTHLKTQQESVDNWGQYINRQSLTVGDALVLLRNMISNDSISAHIIDPDTMLGYSTEANLVNGSDYSVDYTGFDQTFRDMLSSFLYDTSDEDEFRITGAYTNPINGMQCVSFVDTIRLKSTDGQSKSYLLLKVVPVKLLQQQWVFPTGYGDAEIGLITMDGDYVIRSKSMKSENFYEFIRAYNDLTYPQADELKETVNSSESGMLEYNNARGEASCWVYVPVTENSNWLVIGYCSIESLDIEKAQWGLVIYVCLTLGLLFVIDGIYFIYVNRRLRESVRETERANQAKTQFLSTMSHDIRTPMNAVVGMTAVAMRNIDDKQHVSDCLSKIELASDHLLMLINDILDISKIESDQFSLNPTAFSMARLMTNLTNIVRPQIGAKKLNFKVHILNCVQEYLYADELRLNQIFINILSNAVKYTPEGGSITLTLEERPSEENPENLRIVYTVEDTGIGMSEDLLGDLFKPFVRAADSRVSKIEGSGLGLAITYRVVKAMGGEITVKSEKGKGSVFCVTLELPMAENTDQLMLPRMDTLVVDDDEVFLDTAADTLKSLGVKADTAQSGREAVDMVIAKYAKNESYPVIIVDWKMPEMDGIATIRHIRSEIGNGAAIIILSSFDYSDIEKEALDAGANGFINKPVFRSTLYTKIAELLKLSDSAEIKEKEEDLSFAGLHLLVAEDNEMNWDIIRQILEFYQVTADHAENGEVCVKMLEDAPEGKYSAVLMDVHMPVMNGYEATEKIRSTGREDIRRIPIIAMTADAFAEDIKACMDAGMNAHMAKPIDIGQLEEKLAKIKDGGYLE